MDFYEVVMGRKSVRTYDGRDLTPEDRAKIEACAAEAGAGNPFGIPVEFKFLGAEEYGLSSPVLSGEKLYVAGIVDKVPYSDVDFLTHRMRHFINQPLLNMSQCHCAGLFRM